MCGIAGVYDPKGVDPREVKKLSEVLKHRGPDDEGFYLSYPHGSAEHLKGHDTVPELEGLKAIEDVSEAPQLALMHRRLSIIDVSALGHQPFESEDKNYVLIFNGEVYNYREIRKELEANGVQFKSETDTEVVLNAFIEWGEQCVKKFVGMWAFAIYDKKTNALTLSRDRFGIKPLYFYQRNTYFAFASEIKALLKLRTVDKRISNENLASYLSYGTTADPFQNLFLYIEDIQPGCNYRYELSTGMITKTPYYYLEQELPKNNNDLLSNANAFEQHFHDAMDLHLRSDVEVGSCLSGGLDSSAIVYSASRKMKESGLQTFTAAYHQASIDESGFAKSVAGTLKNVKDHYTYPEAKTLLAELDQLVYYQDLPIGSTSVFAQWEVMKCANQHQIKVLLDGQGADETLGGYTNYAGLYLIGLLKGMKFGKFITEYGKLKQNFSPQLRKSLLKAAYYYMPGNFQRKLRANERLSYQFIDPQKINDLSLAIPERGGKNFNDHVNLSMQYGMYDLLRYEDRNSMAFSIESRVPFLDHRLVEFIRGLPVGHLFYGGYSKYVLRKMLDQHLPDEVVWRKDKKGFVTPQQEWKDELMKVLTTEMQELKIPAIMNRNYLMELCQKELKDATHLSEFWRAYSVVKWFNVFNLSDS